MHARSAFVSASDKVRGARRKSAIFGIDDARPLAASAFARVRARSRQRAVADPADATTTTIPLNIRRGGGGGWGKLLQYDLTWWPTNETKQ
jgi:hypothetical protein